jgi:hypothetical protein
VDYGSKENGKKAFQGLNDLAIWFDFWMPKQAKGTIAGVRWENREATKYGHVLIRYYKVACRHCVVQYVLLDDAEIS